MYYQSGQAEYLTLFNQGDLVLSYAWDICDMEVCYFYTATRTMGWA